MSPAQPSPRIPPGPLRRLLVSLPPVNLALFLVWGAVPPVLLAVLVQGIDPAGKERSLALVLAVGALAAMIAQPLAGLLSDRTRSRWGRRTPWLVGGSAAGAAALVLLGQGRTIAQVLAAWVAVQILLNLAQGPLSAVLPDRVPRALRGTFSAATGLGLMLGMLGGQVFGAMFSERIALGTALLGGIALAALLGFSVLNPDADNRGDAVPPLSARAALLGSWVAPLRHPDFVWAFLGRLLLNLGYSLIMTYLLYILQEIVGLSLAEAIVLVPVIAGTGAVFVLLSTVISGPLSDRLRRRRVFVFASAMILTGAMWLPLAMPTVPGVIIFGALAGFGFGIFQAVDTALISEVLPDQAAAGKDLGVINIAATLPQTVAPALAGVIAVSVGYVWLFPVAAVLVFLAGLAVIPIRSVR